MSSSFILRGSRSLFRPSSARNPVLSSYFSLNLNGGVGRRWLSSPPSEPVAPSLQNPESVTEPPDKHETPGEDLDKPRTRRSTRITLPASKDTESVEIPEDLDILWSPADGDSDLNPSELPPPEVLEEALHNLHITLHPQTQHRATYASTSGPPVEPTLGLYCPIEGGDYIIDATVRELARRTGAEVLVLDTVHLAAGEWGRFGKGILIASSTPVCQSLTVMLKLQIHFS